MIQMISTFRICTSTALREKTAHEVWLNGGIYRMHFLNLLGVLKEKKYLKIFSLGATLHIFQKIRLNYFLLNSFTILDLWCLIFVVHVCCVWKMLRNCVKADRLSAWNKLSYNVLTLESSHVKLAGQCAWQAVLKRDQRIINWFLFGLPSKTFHCYEL